MRLGLWLGLGLGLGLGLAPQSEHPPPSEEACPAPPSSKGLDLSPLGEPGLAACR